MIGLTAIGAVIWYHDEGTLKEFLDERLSWTEMYRVMPARRRAT